MTQSKIGIFRSLRIGWRLFWRQLLTVLRNPVFGILAVIGILMLILSSELFCLAEIKVNPAVQSYGDALWWAVLTMSTLGFGDVVPVTGAGRLITGILIFTGGGLFFSFLGLLTAAFVKLEVRELEASVQRLERAVNQLIEAKEIGS